MLDLVVSQVLDLDVFRSVELRGPLGPLIEVLDLDVLEETGLEVLIKRAFGSPYRGTGLRHLRCDMELGEC